MRHHFLADVIVLCLALVKRSHSRTHLHKETELAVEAVGVDFIDDLDVSLLLKFAKFLSFEAHESSAFVSVEVNKEALRDVSDLGKKHVCWHTGRLRFIAAFTAPAAGLFHHFTFALRASQIERPVVILHVRDVATGIKEHIPNIVIAKLTAVDLLSDLAKKILALKVSSGLM